MEKKRRNVFCVVASLISLIAAGMFSVNATYASEKSDKVKVGLMLPYTGTYASLGNAITNGFKLYVAEQGGKLANREVEYYVVDDESDAAKATENANKLIKRDQVDVLVGTVHSGVALAMAKVARDTKTLMIVPNSGANELTGSLCSPYIFRTSFSAWQPAYAMGKVVAERGHKNVVTLTWKYSFGEQSVEAFTEAFENSGGKIVKNLTLPFPDVEFQPYLTQIAALKPDAVFVFFAGAGAVKFVKDYESAGLKNSIPLYAPGFLTDGTLEAMGNSAEGLLTTLHYGDGLDLPKDKVFRNAYVATYKMEPDVYAVQGYDTAQLLKIGLDALKERGIDKEVMIKAMENAVIDSPRGEFSLSKAHNPIQNIYLRQVENQKNKVIGIAAKKLGDPARGCRMQ